MRLYNAICAYVEACARAKSEPAELTPEGAGQAQVEQAHAYTRDPELHAGFQSNRPTR